MSGINLFKKLLPGLLPLFVFIAADEIWGTEVGLITAVSFGIVQLGFTYFKERRIDRFVLVDTGLIVFLGLISVLLENEIFFKIKPVLIGLILCAILGFSAFSGKNLLLSMSKRYMKDVQMNDLQIQYFTRSVKIMFFLFLAHTALTAYAAFYLSKESWAFISGGLFYILFGVYFLYEFVRVKLIKQKLPENAEWFPVVNEEGKILGKATRDQCHSGSMLLHPVVHIHIFNRHRQLFLQKRSQQKDIQPGKWDTAVGGHVDWGESIERACEREVSEEVGIQNLKSRFLYRYIWRSEVESELVHVFVAQYDNKIDINTEELEDGRFWTLKEINHSIGKNIFTPNFEYDFALLKKHLKL